MLAFERADRANRQPPAQPTSTTAAPPPAAVATPPKPKRTSTAPPARTSTGTPKPATAVKPPSGAAGTVVAYALAQVGKAYLFGASGPNSFDCSGLVAASYARVGIRLPHQSEAIAARGRRVPAGQWMPGDVIHTPGHVGVYVGGGNMVAATKPATGVRVGAVRGGTAYRFL